tara:strand:- start:1657 stop:5022 length:3366 start_codon:yes stop_codon:yes gene_type:complete
MEYRFDNYDADWTQVITPFSDGNYQPDPTFFETVGASLRYQWSPSFNKIRSEFTKEIDHSYNPLHDIQGYEMYQDDLVHAKSKSHMNELKRQIDGYEDNRKILHNSSLFAQFGAALFDPINLIALPLGGPAYGIGRSFLRAGLGVAGGQAVAETLRHPFDPTSTWGEVGLNIGAAGVLGGAIGSLVSVPITIRTNAMLRTEQELREFAGQITDTIPQTHIGLLKQNENPMRTFGKASEDDLVRIESNMRGNDTPSAYEAIEQIRIERAMREVEKTLPEKWQPYDLVENAFTNSWIYKAMPTPIKVTLQGNYLQSQKKAILDIAGDLGTMIGINKYGGKSDTPVFIEASTYEGEWVGSYKKLLELYGEATGKGVPTETKMDLFFFRKEFDEFVSDLSTKRMRQDADGVVDELTDIDKRGIKILDDFFDPWGNRLEEQDLIIRNIDQVDRQLARLDTELRSVKRNQDTNNRIANGFEKEYIIKLEKDIESLKRTRTAFSSDDPSMATMTGRYARRRERFYPRIWDRQYILENRAELEGIFRNHYRQHPFIFRYDPQEKQYIQKRLRTDDNSINERVKETIDNILGDENPVTTENISFGHGQSNHLKHRLVDIPNHIVSDFIIKDPVKLMMGYTNRVASQYSFAKKFGETDFDNVLLKLQIEGAKAGQSVRQLRKYGKNLRHSYDRVVGHVTRSPMAFNQRAAQVMKDLATLNYLGSAGFSTLPDAAVVMMQNELKPLFKQVFHVLDNHKVRLNAMEGQLGGEMLEILKGDVMLRLVEETMNNPFQGGTYQKVRGRVMNGYFIANLLGPMTGIFKRMSSMANVHTILAASKRLASGNVSVKDKQYLARLGISKEDAIKFTQQPIEAENGVNFLNSTAWTDKDSLFKFRTALNSSIKHQVLMGTPADKPIMVDGVFYVPMHVARHIPYLREDSIYKGYARIENGLLGMPFQFYSYSLAALNKVTVLYTQGQVRNRLTGIISAMGLAYMGMQLKYRNNPWILDNMSIEDKIARSFDMSGLGAIYSDMFYKAMATSIALGGPNIGGGIVNPKFPPQTDTPILDTTTGILGAGASITTDLTKAAGKFLAGDTGEGAKEFIRNLPLMRLWFLKELTNDMTRAIASGNRY